MAPLLANASTVQYTNKLIVVHIRIEGYSLQCHFFPIIGGSCGGGLPLDSHVFFSTKVTNSSYSTKLLKFLSYADDPMMETTRLG